MRIAHVFALGLIAVAAAGCNRDADTTPAATTLRRPADLPAPPDVAAPPADAGRTPSGLAFKVLKPGSGTIRADNDDIVTIHYIGWTTDGTLFDSTYLRGEPATIPIADAVSGFRVGVQLMVEGEKRRLWIPESLAYKGQPGTPRGMLVFDVELITIQK